MFRQVCIALVATISLSVLVDSRTAHDDNSLGIIGGKEATPHEAKSMVRFLFFTLGPNGEKIYFGGACGGTLISDQYILTVKHCGRGREGALVLLGMHDTNNNTEGETQVVNRSPDSFIEHPSADLLLVKLGSPITPSDKVDKISLPLKKDENETYVGQKGSAFGWGRTEKGEASRYLLKVEDLSVISNTQCASELSTFNLSGPNSYELCTSGNSPSDPKGTCSGDSGGPLYINNVLVGVTANGPSDCTAGGPSVYISTGQFLQWIGTSTGIDLP